MTTDRTSLTITDDRRRLEDVLRGKLGDKLPDSQFRAPLYDMALQNLLDTIENHEEYDGPPQYAVEFNTRVVKSRTRTNVELKRP